MTKSEYVNGLEYHLIHRFRKDIKPNIFVPQSPRDIENLEVTVEVITNIDYYYSYVSLVSSWNCSLTKTGRFIPYLVKEKSMGRILGVIVVSSAGIHNGKIAEHIGWTNDNKFGEQRRLQKLAYAKTIIPTRSFGTNCLGGKLLAKLCQTQFVINTFEGYYFNRDITVGIYTNGLNSDTCQYRSIPGWKPLGHSIGNKNNPPRPTFLCPFYKNYKEYLCGQIEQDKLIPNGNLIPDIKSAVDTWWKPKAIRYMTKRIAEGRLDLTEEYYDSLSDHTEPSLGFIE